MKHFSQGCYLRAAQSAEMGSQFWRDTDQSQARKDPRGPLSSPLFSSQVGKPNAGGKPASVTKQQPSVSAARRFRTDTSPTQISCAKAPPRPARASAPTAPPQRGAEAGPLELEMPAGATKPPPVPEPPSLCQSPNCLFLCNKAMVQSYDKVAVD